MLKLTVKALRAWIIEVMAHRWRKRHQQSAPFSPRSIRAQCRNQRRHHLLSLRRLIPHRVNSSIFPNYLHLSIFLGHKSDVLPTATHRDLLGGSSYALPRKPGDEEDCCMHRAPKLDARTVRFFPLFGFLRLLKLWKSSDTDHHFYGAEVRRSWNWEMRALRSPVPKISLDGDLTLLKSEHFLLPVGHAWHVCDGHRWASLVASDLTGQTTASILDAP